MLVSGLLPLIAIVGFGLWVWAQHGFTLLLSITAEGVLVSMAFADVLLISGGVYLLNRPKSSN
jgi:type IV secretory pathway TrbD component